MSKKHNKQLQPNDAGTSFVVNHQQVCFSGPLPHPVILKGYDEICPGAADRIIKMAEEQSKHRQDIEKKVINSDVGNSKIGLWFAFIIGMTGVIGGTGLILENHIITGSILSGVTICSLVGTFIYGSQGRRQEREEKNKGK